ncbi:MAG: glycosyltransferase [Acidobacteria bacterium]|nr:MAG: glycosyltransferase [Acidobacteriota bacterium]
MQADRPTGESAAAFEDPPPHAVLEVLEVETFGSGGLAHYADNLARALAAQGHRVALLTTRVRELDAVTPDRGAGSGDGARILRRLAPWAQRLERSPRLVASGLRKLEALLDAVRIAVTVLRTRPGIVHLHCTNPAALVHALLVRLVAPLSGGPRLVATSHVVLPHEPMPLQRQVFGSLYRLCHAVIAHSRHDRDRLIGELGVDPSRVAVIPHGDYGFFASQDAGIAEKRQSARSDLALGEGDEVALFFGYVREYKGLDVLLDAWPEVAARRPRARLVVAGDPVRLPPERRRELRARAEGLGAVVHLEYVPFERVESYFAAADVLVLPYRRVSQSGVLYLALALGLPVVASRIGAWSEMLADGENALLVEPQSPGEIADAVASVLADPALGQRLAAGGRALAAEHSWPRVAERTAELFAALAR